MIDIYAVVSLQQVKKLMEHRALLMFDELDEEGFGNYMMKYFANIAKTMINGIDNWSELDEVSTQLFGVTAEEFISSPEVKHLLFIHIGLDKL